MYLIYCAPIQNRQQVAYDVESLKKYPRCHFGGLPTLIRPLFMSTQAHVMFLDSRRLIELSTVGDTDF